MDLLLAICSANLKQECYMYICMYIYVCGYMYICLSIRAATNDYFDNPLIV